MTTKTDDLTALVVEGGAMRGAFSAGVLDAFLEDGFDPFDLYVGVSAGATNLASHLAGQHGRNRRVYTDYSCRPECISFCNYLRGGHYIDLDWLWDITIREIRLDLDAILGKEGPFVMGVTSVETGEPVYLEPTRDDLEDMLKASCAMPFVYRGFHALAGQRVVDGGVADPIPVREAHRRGARTIMVVRTRPADFTKRRGLEARLFALMAWRYPALRRAMLRRAAVYNDTLGFIAHPPSGTRILQVTPPADLVISRTARDPALLERGHQIGRESGRRAIAEFADLVAGGPGG